MKVKIIRKYVLKFKLYLYILICQKLLISCEKLLISAKLRGCVYIYDLHIFLDIKNSAREKILDNFKSKIFPTKNSNEIATTEPAPESAMFDTPISRKNELINHH